MDNASGIVISVDDNDALEDLLNESIDLPSDEGDEVADEQEEQEAEAEAEADNGLPDLDDLLKESVTARNDNIAAKAAKDRLKRGGQSTRERLEDLQRLAAWEAAHEWEAKANVAHFGVQVCACGATHSLFFGLMERQTHRHLRTTQRWVKVDTTKAALPNEVVYRTSKAAMCQLCCTEKGWSWSTATVWQGG
jgi:hypothetical protein